MIQVEDKIISMDVLEKQFVCDLNACRGACCVEGDSGAPLLKEEEKTLDEIYEKVKPYMRKEGITEIENQGVAVYDLEVMLIYHLDILYNHLNPRALKISDDELYLQILLSYPLLKDSI